jgi:transposase
VPSGIASGFRHLWNGALDGQGAIVQRAQLSRTTVFTVFAAARPALVGMEACPGSQWLARKLIDAWLVPARLVKPFAKSNKNDTLDAEAIAKAVRRPTMRFIQLRRPEQFDPQALHPEPRPRDRARGAE